MYLALSSSLEFPDRFETCSTIFPFYNTLNPSQSIAFIPQPLGAPQVPEPAVLPGVCCSAKTLDPNIPIHKTQMDDDPGTNSELKHRKSEYMRI
jgi:hypothetical protein